MMQRVITALRRGKARKNRVNVFLDDEYGFSVSELMAARLHLGQALADEEIEEIQRQDAANTAQERALGLLEVRPRSRAELVRRLRKAGFTPEATEAAVGRLERVDLVDDEAFARFWVEQRLAFRPRSRRALAFELRQQGLAKDVIDTALAGVDDAATAADLVERHRRRQAGKPARAPDGDTGEADAARVEAEALSKLLRSRGFDYRTIKDTLAGLIEVEDTGPAPIDNLLEDDEI